MLFSKKEMLISTMYMCLIQIDCKLTSVPKRKLIEKKKQEIQLKYAINV